MNKSPRTDLHVFDFNEEEEERQQHNEIAKFRSPILNPPLLSNHDTHENKVNAENDVDITCVDVDTLGDKFNPEKSGLDLPLDTLEYKFDRKDSNSELEHAKKSNFTSHENHCNFKVDIYNHDEPEAKDTSGEESPQTSQMDPSRSPSSNESVDVNSEADECMNESLPSSPASDIVENVSSNGCDLNGRYGYNMVIHIQASMVASVDDANMEVVLHPDYVIYQDNYYMGPKLTFSHYCIKINVSTTCIKQGALELEWPVDDLVDIKCKSFQSSATIILKLRVISCKATESNQANTTSGIEELEIAVVDSNWSLRHKQITSLNMKYSDIWKIVLHCSMDIEGNDNYSEDPRSYFPNFVQPFDEVIYPKGDPDAVSLSKRDVDLLRPDTFVNDTIIDFYIQYLKSQIQDEEKSRYHFFNSFFFRKLADMDKNPASASDGKAAFLRVRKWTRKVKLFEKDYIFIPVNFNLHWSLIVICHPGEVVNFNDKERDKSLKVPCILHMDSIKGSHCGLKNLVQSYLWEEWKERHATTLEEDLESRFLNMRFLSLALPQQENSYDCGLFLLHYLELFLSEAPSNFNPFKLTKFSNFLNVDWFLPAEAYLKRTLIQRLIFELVENRGSHEISSSDCSDDDNIYIENNENRSVQHPEINRESANSHAGQGIEITLLPASSSLDPQSLNNSGLVLKDLFEPGTSAGTLVGQCQSFGQRSSDYRFNGSIFSVEEDADLGEHYMYLTSDPNFQQAAAVTPQACSLPYLPRDYGDDTCHRSVTSLHTEHNMAESSLDESSGGSDDSDDIGIVENCPIGNEADLGQINRHPPMKNPEYLTDVPVSGGNNLPIASLTGIVQDLNTNCHGNQMGDLKVTCDDGQMIDEKVTCNNGQMNNDMVTCDNHTVGDNVTCENVKMVDDFVACEDGPMVNHKFTSEDGDVVDDKVTCDDQMVEDKVTGEDGQMADDKVASEDGHAVDYKATCGDGQMADDKVTCGDQIGDDKVTYDNGKIVDDKAICDNDGQLIDGTALDICEEQAAKRRRLMPQQCRSEEVVTDSDL
ncbi:probable ubiquitin-like-specific protease 2B isoform X2 [Arachis hypogaea]|uniref:probable ubiquitin-like-specific protease 2B isoform X2 n=1 Tax=Arachis hypogaea TaxID=3818 RepID=UPI000DED0F06|nr:probable ubiquitin-like-specific protease 2B isoform X1 [Arachis hypogaea]